MIRNVVKKNINTMIDRVERHKTGMYSLGEVRIIS